MVDLENIKRPQLYSLIRAISDIVADEDLTGQLVGYAVIKGLEKFSMEEKRGEHIQEVKLVYTSLKDIVEKLSKNDSSYSVLKNLVSIVQPKIQLAEGSTYLSGMKNEVFSETLDFLKRKEDENLEGAIRYSGLDLTSAVLKRGRLFKRGRIFSNDRELIEKYFVRGRG